MTHDMMTNKVQCVVDKKRQEKSVCAGGSHTELGQAVAVDPGSTLERRRDGLNANQLGGRKEGDGKDHFIPLTLNQHQLPEYIIKTDVTTCNTTQQDNYTQSVQRINKYKNKYKK